jgi:Cu-processing system permease protein
MALLVLSGGEAGGDALPYVLLLNPADIFRVLNIFGMQDLKNLYGLATVFPPALADPWVLTLAMLGWIVLPLSLASWRFK